MFKHMIVLAFLVVAAFAAPQALLRSYLDNEGAKQIGLPYSNGWTDGPNNGIGPHAAIAVAPAVYSSPLLHGSPYVSPYAAQYFI